MPLMDDFEREGTATVVLLHQTVEAQAARNGKAIAVDENGREISYAELAMRASRLASLLIMSGVRRGDRVAFLIDNGIESCVAMLGIMRADACFVALNPAWPALRIAAILDDAEPAAILGFTALWPLLDYSLRETKKASPRALVCLDGEFRNFTDALKSRGSKYTVYGREALDRAESNPPPCRNTGDDLAYILFTSGTTGTPKGVMVSHKAILSTIRWGAERFAINDKDRLSNHSRLSFDVSLFDIFCAFLAGATVCPLTAPGECAFPGDFIHRQRITVWFSVPSVIAMMTKARQLAAGRFEHLRAALFAGEALPPESVAAWFRHQPHVPIYNLYGPTEAAIVCTCHEIGADSPFSPDRPIPIGRETRDSRLLILKQDAETEAPVGEIGRLMICGAQLAAGYWRRPDLTAKSFLPNVIRPAAGDRMYDTGDIALRDDSGIIHFVGRADTQVKIRGYRIELGEIDVVLGSCSGVREAAAFVVGEGEDRRIVAAVVSDDLDEDILFMDIEKKLPAYMIPARVLFLDELPRNASGKVDRAQLAKMA